MRPFIKTTIRTIYKTMGRFLAILAIIALGVGFFSGLYLTTPSFLETGDEYLRRTRFYDFNLLSTIGFDSEDIELISSLDDVSNAVGAVSYDAIFKFEDSNIDDNPSVVSFHSITSGVNEVSLECGRMPERDNEILLDGYFFGETDIGRKLLISDLNTDETIDNFLYDEYVVVGTCYSPLYLHFQRGTTDVGKGTVDFFAYCPIGGLESEYFTEAYIYYNTPFVLYSEEYKSYIDDRMEYIEQKVDEIILNRYQSIIEEAEEEYNDALDDYNRENSEALEELEDGYEKLINGSTEIRDAYEEIISAREEISDGFSLIADYREQISNGQEELNNNESYLLEQRQLITAGISEAEASKQELLLTLEETNSSLAEIEYGISMGLITEDMEETILYLNGVISEINSGISMIDSTIAELNNNLLAVDEGLATISSTRDELNGRQIEIDNSYYELCEAREELEQGELDYEEAIREYNEGLETYYQGKSEYQFSIVEANKELVNARNELNEAKEDLPSTYCLGRDKNVGYLSFDNDVNIVSGIANVFPLFFFALAALVCSTTMGRMVSDERGQIGTMRSLGYSKLMITMKYASYSGLASIIGCILGFSLGTRIFPQVIWACYEMMYGFAPIILVTSRMVFVFCLIVSLICSVGVTVFTAYGELKGTPADLIRPKAPLSGKKILLERIGFLWSKLSFAYKVSLRNVFRFKKRMLMMLIGIAGSTALLFAAFGINDTIKDLVNLQFDEIQVYDIELVYKDSASTEEINSLIIDSCTKVGIDPQDVSFAHAMNDTYKHEGEDMVRDVKLFVSDDPNISDCWQVHVNGDVLSFPEEGIAISSKLANVNGLNPGDLITLLSDDNENAIDANIAYVFDNYTYHFAFLTGANYEKLMGNEYEPNSAYINIDMNKYDDSYIYSLSKELSSHSKVTISNVVLDMRISFQETMNQLNVVVLLVIVCAALLAFIVLFNLNNINITERVREIATLKVIGLSKRETGSYFFRENFILVFMGYVCGIPLGLLLLDFVIKSIDMDIITFVTQLKPISYVISFLMLLAFSFIVDLVMRVKIERINMAESLKSVE